MIFQSQLQKVNWRSASSDLKIKPLFSTVEDLGMLIVLLAAKFLGDRNTYNHKFVRIEQEAGTQSRSASVNAIFGIPSGGQGQIPFL